MHTKTSKAVIGPLADAVSSLVLIISDAEINKAAMPDLTALAKIVDDQIAHLTAVGLKISSQAAATDAQLSVEMPDACSQVKKSSDLLLAGTEVLAKDAYSSAGRNSLLDGVKGILRNTANILTIMDDLEVRKLLTSMTHIRAFLSTISDQENALSTETDPTEIAKLENAWVVTVATYSQTFTAFLQQCHKRVVEIIDQSLQVRLESAISTLAKESPLLLSACRVVVTRIGVARSKYLLTSTLQRMNTVIDEIETVIKIRPDDDVFNFDSAAEEQRTKTVDSVIHNIRFVIASKGTNIQPLVAEYNDITNSVYTGTKRVMNLVPDASQRSLIQSQLESILKADVETTTALKALVLRPDHTQAQQDVNRCLNQSTNAHNLLKFVRNRVLVGTLASSYAMLSDPSGSPHTYIGAVFDASMKGNRGKLPTAISNFEAETHRWMNLCTSVLDLCPTASLQISLEARNCIRSIEGTLPMISASAHLNVLQHTDPNANQNLELVGKRWVDGMQSGLIVARESFTPFEIVSGLQQCFAQHGDGLEAACAANDAEVALMQTAACLSTASQLATVVRRSTTAVSDLAYKNSLELRVQEMEKVLPQFTLKAKQILDTKKVGDVLDMHNCIKETALRFSAIEDLMRMRYDTAISAGVLAEATNAGDEKSLAVEGISVQILEHAGDTVVLDEEPPRLMPEAEAKLDPIQAAAQEIKVEASNWSPKENPIVDASIKISDHLSTLAKLHKLLLKDPTSTTAAESKRSFIQAAKQIHTECLKIVASAKPIADRCSDARLQKQLSSSLQWIENLAQQLKIVAAVKTSAPLDTDRDQQLVTCAKNVMVAVKNCIRDSEAGTLRLSPDVSSVAAGENGRANHVAGGHSKALKGKAAVPPIVKFKRNVYRKKVA
ncbi:hypothetical protein HDU77_000836 [Chytriomyces hyalinus]|nr:hypothetical protein HDU77_000836 [Chytriomyces hyalinus]